MNTKLLPLLLALIASISASSIEFLYTSTDESVVFPNDAAAFGEAYIISIVQFAFYDCPDLTSIIIPNTVTSIDKEAFSTCKNLTSVTVNNNDPANITLGSYVFKM